jgi:glycosyltransferase involved in cell wall biosynthesis
MNVGIYNNPSGQAMGGGTYTIAVLARALAQRHSVEIVHHSEGANGLSIPRLEVFSGMTLDGVTLRYVERDWARWHPAQLSGAYDLFVNMTHVTPVPGRATVNVLRVLFPQERRITGARGRRRLLAVRRAIEHARWRRWPRTYQLIIANSRFTQEWTRRRWGVESQVLHSPVDARRDVDGASRAPLILSVGRFFPSKKQREMLGVFQAIASNGAHGWRYTCVGNVSSVAMSQDYLGQLRALAAGATVDLQIGVDRATLRRIQGQAAIFWHGMGLGEDLERYPERAEHFGIATVEAMAAGCVPLVFDGGGQREIVQHGESGFRWRTLDELRDYTLLLMKDEALRARMADAARGRAELFGREHFVARFATLLDPLLPGLGPLTL